MPPATLRRVAALPFPLRPRLRLSAGRPPALDARRGWPCGRSHAAWSLPLVLLLFAALLSACALPGSQGTIQALAHPPHPTATACIEPLPTGLVRFSDTIRHTNIGVQTTTTGPLVGIFDFVISSGSQYYGGQPGDLTAGSGSILMLHYSGTVQYIAVGNASAAQLTTAKVQVNATVDLCHRQAKADLADVTTGQRYTLVTFIPGGELAAVQRFDQAVIQQDWATVYSLSVLAGSLTESQFAAQMEQGVQTTGAVTAIKISSSPVVTVNVYTGQTIFLVNQEVTYSHSGATKVVSSKDIFVVDDGVWKFFTSAAA